MNIMNFLYSLAERMNLLVYLKIFPDNLVLRGRVSQSQMQVEWVSETIVQKENVPGTTPEILMVLKFLFQIQTVLRYFGHRTKFPDILG